MIFKHSESKQSLKITTTTTEWWQPGEDSQSHNSQSHNAQRRPRGLRFFVYCGNQNQDDRLLGRRAIDPPILMRL
jgi:hypothetical protein